MVQIHSLLLPPLRQERELSIDAPQAPNVYPFSLEIEAVTKSFGPRLVLRGIDLKLKQGEFLTIFGPNGAGKTTLIKILSTITRPSSGKVSIAGMDIAKDPVEARRLVGVVSHDSMLYGNLTASENLEFYGKMYDVPGLAGRVASLLEQVGLGQNRDQRVATFSHGMQKRLSIARAFLHDPALLLLDEPETGLDQQGIAMLLRTLSSLGAEKKTILMTTHGIERGLRSCRQVAILNRGRIVYQQEAAQLRECDFGEIYSQHTEAR
ncbi:MAG: heme ABC exporter ATP-binding protein CcmA [Chloroflexi bacterium]|nr:heme ABC exporter ATP-binding protein CcmA [Chloroflexota bacterium]